MSLTPAEKEHGKWYLLFKRINSIDPFNFDTSDCIRMDAPPNHFYADPFSVEKDGIHYIFFEQLEFKSPTQHKGWLSWFQVDADNNVSGPHNLDIPAAPHMSFPYIFQHGNDWFMVPETCHLNCVNLYQCTEWPGRWEFVKTLIPNTHNGDSQLIFHNQKWWMFTQALKNNSYYFCIYWADDLMGAWHPHEVININQAQPDNEKLTRGAGRIFAYGDKLIRPAQMSHKGINGEAVILYEIKCLTERTYHEVPLTIISTTDLETGRATHTFSMAETAVVMDARNERPGIDPAQLLILTPTDYNKIMESNYYINHDMLKEAFSINTSGNGKCYYGITIDGHTYPGERNWDLRWNLIKDCIDWTDKNVMDFGCNMGVSLTYLQKFRNIFSACGVEAPDEFLQKTDKPRTIEALKKLEEAFGLPRPASIYRIDLNDVDNQYERVLEWSPLPKEDSVAIAMSILKWIDDKDRFLTHLSNSFNTVIYEGHESDEEELSRFAKYGFTGKILGKTQTGASYPDDDMRTLILFTK